MKRSTLGLALALAISGPAHAAPPTIVAAENFYGDVASQLAGPGVAVTSILSNPDQDPHLFEASASTARAIAGAAIVIRNGADYDPWMDKLLAAAASSHPVDIVAAELVHAVPGANPHLWYDPATMLAVARAVSAALAQADPAHGPAYAARLATFEAALAPVQARIATMRRRLAGTPVTATEPVFGYMAAALGLPMRNERFQLAVMNGTEPAISDVAAFEDDLRQHRVRLFIYNSQASDPAAVRLRDIAAEAHVPQIGVTETEPAGLTYQAWMTGTLDALDRALGKPAS